jgi:DNA-binding NarL/FixJ family response regulator
VAHRLGVSPRTVHKHLQVTYATLGVSSRAAAIGRAVDCWEAAAA